MLFCLFTVPFGFEKLNSMAYSDFDSTHPKSSPLCFPVIPFIVTNYAQNYAHKFNELKDRY